MRSDDKGLAELGSLPNLKSLELRSSKSISDAGIAQFIKDHPTVSVKR